jgi:hypothetical protein
MKMDNAGTGGRRPVSFQISRGLPSKGSLFYCRAYSGIYSIRGLFLEGIFLPHFEGLYQTDLFFNPPVNFSLI